MMRDMFNVPKDPHPGEPDELTPDTAPIDDIERPHQAHGTPDVNGWTEDQGTESPEKDLDEPGPADRTPRP
jgi:hypothetical protein